MIPPPPYLNRKIKLSGGGVVPISNHCWALTSGARDLKIKRFPSPLFLTHLKIRGAVYQ